MINLFENYGYNESLLVDSLYQSGYYNQTIVLTDDGYLPVFVNSPIGFFTGMDLSKGLPGSQPKFFNELEVPSYWEIIGDLNSASIFDGYKKKGQIFYSQRFTGERFINSVDWLNDEGRVRVTDLYNQNGWRFGRKTYSDGEHTLTSYFSETGTEVILINHITNTIQVVFNNKKYLFESFEKFILFYFEVAQLPIRSIFYNSLGRPFFIINLLKSHYIDEEFSHILFWQEVSETIPGNMKYIIEDQASPTKQIIVQKKSEFSNIKNSVNGNKRIQIDYLGFIYRFKKEPVFKQSVLILTNSDQIAQIYELIRLLPNFQIKIAAKTEMSSKLMELEKFSNIELYPQVTSKEIENLFTKVSIYLDINYGNEVDNAISTAFLQNLLIFSFDETIHNEHYILNANIFKISETTELANRINDFLENREDFNKKVFEQQLEAEHSSVWKYKEILK